MHAGLGVWLFTRDQESVRLAVQPAPAGFRLTIVGPGSANAEFEFADPANLDRFRVTYENDLRDRGFVLQGASERRRMTDRRAAPRETPSRRR